MHAIVFVYVFLRVRVPMRFCVFVWVEGDEVSASDG